MMYFKIITFVISATSLVLFNLRKQYYSKFVKYESIDDKYSFESMFLFAQNSKCKKHLYRGVTCGDKCAVYNLNHIVKFIETARYNLNMCMCILTSEAIIETLIVLHNNGVKVKLIIDRLSRLALLENGKAAYLKSKGIPVKVPKSSDDIMHHRFSYWNERKTGKGELFLGSLNLTHQGFTSNWENLVFTNNLRMLNEYDKLFEYLWKNTEFI